MGNDSWAIVGAMAVLVVPLLMAWWLIGADERRSRKSERPRGRAKIGH